MTKKCTIVFEDIGESTSQELESEGFSHIEIMGMLVQILLRLSMEGDKDDS